VFTGNEVGSLLGWWMMQVRLRQRKDQNRDDCYFIASTVSSKMLRAVAKAEKMHFEETLTGFKWMGNRARELEEEGKVVLLAYEESIGYMCGTTVLDKDGVSGATRAAELAAALAKEHGGRTLSQHLDELYRTYGYHCSEVSYFTIVNRVSCDGLFEKLRTFGGEGNTVRRYGSPPSIDVSVPNSIQPE